MAKKKKYLEVKKNYDRICEEGAHYVCIMRMLNKFILDS